MREIAVILPNVQLLASSLPSKSSPFGKRNIDLVPNYHNIISLCMTRAELEKRLELFLAAQPGAHFKVSGSSGAGFRVELALRPNTPITERFIRELEAALPRQIGSLSVFRIRRNVFIIRLALKRSHDEDSAADRVEEFPALYACAG
jgi:hypothetical protein